MGGAGSTGRVHDTLSRVPLSLGGLIHRLLWRAWFGKGHAGISPNRSGTETPLAWFWSGMRAVLALGEVRQGRTQLGAPQSPVWVSNFVGSHGGKTSWKRHRSAEPSRVPKGQGCLGAAGMKGLVGSKRASLAQQ